MQSTLEIVGSIIRYFVVKDQVPKASAIGTIRFTGRRQKLLQAKKEVKQILFRKLNLPVEPQTVTSFQIC